MPVGKKRQAQADNKPNKKQKLQLQQEKKKIIPIPAAADDSDEAVLSDQNDEEGFLSHGAASFLTRIDTAAISRSKSETERLHKLSKPARQPKVVDDDLPSINSDSDGDDSDLGSFGEDNSSIEFSDDDYDGVHEKDDDQEMPYEALPRKVKAPDDSKEKHVQRLPIKLSNGHVQKTGRNENVKIPDPVEPSSSEESDAEELEPSLPLREDVSTGARFGRPAVIDILNTSSRKKKVQLAKEQIGEICQDILADPENSLGLLRRLHTFCLPKVSTPLHPEPVQNDVIIQKMSLLSQLAVFKDIVPGYRIRELTDKEKAEKVTQIVAKTREWEQGLVGVYQNYLRVLESSLKERGELAGVALQCICTLATELTHFNFRTNLLACIVSYLSKKSWNDSSTLCHISLVKIFKADNTGEASLEIVRLLNRMVKEKKFAVHPSVLTCLLSLRLNSELGVRASVHKADKAEDQPKQLSKARAAQRRAKGKKTDTPHLSKKAAKAMKERKEILKEMREAEAEVDKEQRAATHTETLKLLFVLYFRILKNPTPTLLLPAALRGISKYSHLVNIDFFKDLMQVIKGLITREEEQTYEDPAQDEASTTRRLLCVITAFELLKGQGEALNLDLTDFITSLYSIILPLSVSIAMHPRPAHNAPSSSPHADPSTLDTLIRALTLVFPPNGPAAPTSRAAAFSKRLLIASLHLPPAGAERVLEFVRGLLAKDPRLEVLVEESGAGGEGMYLPEVDDPQVCAALSARIWETCLVSSSAYPDQGARKLASTIVDTLTSVR